MHIIGTLKLDLILIKLLQSSKHLHHIFVEYEKGIRKDQNPRAIVSRGISRIDFS